MTANRAVYLVAVFDRAGMQMPDGAANVDFLAAIAGGRVYAHLFKAYFWVFYWAVLPCTFFFCISVEEVAECGGSSVDAYVQFVFSENVVDYVV